MNRSSTSGSGARLRPGGQPGWLDAARQALEGLRPGTPAVDDRPDRADVRAAVLLLLAEQPLDGYRIVRLLEERGAGARTPGAGAVYPTLQLLGDEGLATAEEADGRRTWSLTPAGRVAADAARGREQDAPAPATAASARRGALARSAGQLGQAVALVAQTGGREQVAEAVGVLDDARRRLLAILARD